MNRHEPSSTIGSLRTGAFRRGLSGLIALGLLGLLAPACINRPVAPQQPRTEKSSIARYKSDKVDKIDLLFMIDNSASMADKQKILADAVPDLVEKLVNPDCVNIETQEHRANTGTCPDGWQPEFDAIRDIHIGVITSSIGGHGASICDPENGNGSPRHNDKAHLIAVDLEGNAIPTWQNKGFLNWDPDKEAKVTGPDGVQKDAPGETNKANLIQNFQSMVKGAGENGCGFEASLEAWYRFLVDPAPYERMVRSDCFGQTGACRSPEGIDQTVLQQRADFLRPDSLLAVIMLSDENDCSVIDGGQAYLALEQGITMAPGTKACEKDPNSPDCHTCFGVGDPEKCPTGETWSDPGTEDPLNLRCFDQKRRFGMNMLQPIRRYVDGLTKDRFDDGDPNTKDPFNPVFCPKYAERPDPNDPQKLAVDPTECEVIPRQKSLVFLGGIVGVPWQDIARNPKSLLDGYVPAQQLAWTKKEFEAEGLAVPKGVTDKRTLWQVILGETTPDMEIDPNVDPADPLMKESVAARTGTHPVTGEPVAPPGAHQSEPGKVNSINGAEWEPAGKGDLQYACVFELPEPITCTGASCDCSASSDQTKNPLCWDADAGAYGATQFRAKAYPGRRQLAVLKGVGEQSIVASICPAKVDPDSRNDADWGYRPAIGAIVERLKSALQGQCWDQPLAPDADGSVQCIVVEATKASEHDGDTPICPPCEGDGPRQEPSARTMAALQADPDWQNNGLECACVIPQVPAENGRLRSCIEDPNPQVDGWCYLDPERNPNADKASLASCPDGQRRLIRFVGATSEIPKAGSLTFLQCVGAEIDRPADTTSGAGGSGED